MREDFLRGRGGRDRGTVLVGEFGGGTPLLLANLVEEGVARDSPQPAFEGSGLVVAEAAPDPEEDLLGKVRGVVAITGKTVSEVVDGTPIVTGDLLPGGYGLVRGHLGK
jgi:hypothetical protein